MGSTGLRQTEDRRYTVGPSGMPPTGNTRGHSLQNSNMLTGGRGGTAQGIADMLGGGGNYTQGYNVPAPKIATINVRVSAYPTSSVI